MVSFFSTRIANIFYVQLSGIKFTCHVLYYLLEKCISHDTVLKTIYCPFLHFLAFGVEQRDSASALGTDLV